jgi:hypothetical protein
VGGDEQVQAAIEHLVDLLQPGTSYENRAILRRKDLEQDLWRIAGAGTTNVFFYEVSLQPGGKADDASVWAAVPDGSEAGAYRFYGFDGAEGFNDVSREFNRLAAQLRLSLSDEQTIALAQFFIRCCVPGGPSELIPDEDSLRHSVERYYLSVFGDTPRMLEASFQWLRAYDAAKSGAGLAPSHNGHVIVDRILLTFGAYPQLQQWDLQISHDGSIHSISVKPVFPKGGGDWIFYDFHSNLKSFGTTPTPYR